MQELDNYCKELRTINMVKANIYAVFSIIPIALTFGIPYYLIWGYKFSIKNINQIFPQILDVSLNPYLFGFFIIFILMLGIIIHELIHGITWFFFTKRGFKSITFGVLWKMLTPYCHCKEPLLVKHYILGAIMPAIILGLLPASYAIACGNPLYLVFGIFFTIAATGDFLVISLLLKEGMSDLVLDHPSEAGYFLYKNIKPNDLL